ncbi:MAG: FtsQ-type POTRA domain-containing protein [Clostridia bacterium]|nr:FtsQ-type POTRA domain-containing protein [Clostridia bacterium]
MEDDEIVISVDLTGKSQKEKKKIRQIGKKIIKKKDKDIRTSRTIREKGKVSLLKKIFILILVVIAIWGILHTKLFSVKNIVVLNNNHLTKEEIISISGINQGDNIYKRSAKEIKKALLENTYIEDVTIKKKLPNTIEIDITERNINYMIQFSDTYVYLSNQGYMLEQTSEKANVPIIVGLSTDQNSVVIGGRLNNEDLSKMNRIIKICELAKVNELSEFISKIDISNEKNYVVEMESRGKVINFGDCSNYSDLNTKMLYLTSILAVTDNSKEEIFLNVDLNTNKVYSRPIS